MSEWTKLKGFDSFGVLMGCGTTTFLLLELMIREGELGNIASLG